MLYYSVCVENIMDMKAVIRLGERLQLGVDFCRASLPISTAVFFYTEVLSISSNVIPYLDKIDSCSKGFLTLQTYLLPYNVC